MRDADEIRAALVDDIMFGQSRYRLGDVLEGELILGDELAMLFGPHPQDWRSRAERVNDLEEKCRAVVGRFVRQHLDDEVRAGMERSRSRDEYGERDPVAWEMRVTGSSY